ncbi:MAG: hypothetical protein B7Y90_10285 [Alphaproteobacteria bacterium 32-64-14]|nr:MAG: hypothetical protein B7Y90_10285 [Alphaproteobacteria bacterium 32-64-14]
MTTLTPDIAEKFASLALGHIAREFPYKMDHVFTGPQDVIAPRTAHPIFYGSFDWHSCVHGYWLMARLLRRQPDMPSAPRIRAQFAEAMTPENVTGELAYLARPMARSFERPYGWAWLLALQAELELHTDGELATAAVSLRPLAQAFAQRFHAFLPLADYPIRTGVHSSTAFAIRMSADWAEAFDPALFDLMREKCQAWYGGDRDCPAWEPSLDDFHSPALSEMECMRRMLQPATFREWLGRFMPRLAQGHPTSLFAPAKVSDRTDGKIAHLDGLNFSRAWCWRALAAQLGDHPISQRARESADRHLDASLPHVAGDYMGEHWLATFALLALDA